MNIREETSLIIRKDGKYLVGKVICSPELRWSIYPWDAWRTRIRAKARTVAERTGGEIVLFNPVAGQIRKYKEGAGK